MKTKLKDLPLNIIPYPQQDSEFDVQAELWRRLKEIGFDVRGEVRAVCDDGGKRSRTRLDLVVFDNRRAIAIIECKNSDKSTRCVVTGRQGRRYSKFSLPLFLCVNRSKIDLTVELVRENSLTNPTS